MQITPEQNRVEKNESGRQGDALHAVALARDMDRELLDPDDMGGRIGIGCVAEQAEELVDSEEGGGCCKTEIPNGEDQVG